ncbi:MAG: O-antigen ligase family protein [Acidobacteria bacterium]|nr:O-antigen ligase family protein [Acidobacteriota bacterium]
MKGVEGEEGRTARAGRATTTALLAISVLAFPIPYGAVLPGGRLLIQALAFLALATSATIVSRPAIGAARLALVSLLGVAILGTLQLAPLPLPLLVRLSPVSAEIHSRANEVLALFGRDSITPRISIAPTETLQATLFIAACAALFIAASAVSSRATRRWLGWLVVFAAAAQIVWAVTTQRDDERIHGAFVNPNHFAGYLQIALAVTFAFVVESILTGGDREARKRDPLEKMHSKWAPIAWRVLAWGVIVIGILVTRSRGGIVAAAASSIVMLVVALSMRHVRHHRAFATAGSGAIVAGVALALATTGRWPLLRFFATDPRDAESDLRVTLWRLSIEAWRDFPIFGSGLGTFREAFRRVQPAGTNLLVEQAHHDALQMLVTGGVVGLALSAFAIVTIGCLLARGAISNRHREGSAWSLAGLGAIVALTLHGLVEFNFSIPAIPATLAIVTGLAWGSAREEEKGGAGDSSVEESRGPRALTPMA